MLLDLLCYMRLEENGDLHPMILSYNMDTPYGVEIQLSPDVTWVFARELLIAGMEKRTGDGDVVVEPCLLKSYDNDFTNYIKITFRNDIDQISIYIKQEVVTHFISAILNVVPLGLEANHLNIDAIDDELNSLLTEGNHDNTT